MSRDHLLNSKDPKKVWNFSLARRKDLFFVFGRFFLFLWDSQHDTREEERRVGVARANIRAKRRSRKRDRKKEGGGGKHPFIRFTREIAFASHHRG